MSEKTIIARHNTAGFAELANRLEAIACEPRAVDTASATRPVGWVVG